MPSLQILRQWLFRLGEDVQLPIVLGQRRIFILPSRTGLGFSVVLIVMLLGAINYDLALGHALIFLLAGIGLVGMVHTFRNLYGLSLMPGHPEPVFAGDTVRFPLTVVNPGKEPRRALRFCFGEANGVSLDLPGDGQGRIDIPCPAQQRGWLSPGRIRLSTDYPLGLFTAWSYPHPPFACLIYPQPLNLPLPGTSAMPAAGSHRGERGQEDFTGLRQWQSNDSPRHIAWKAVARDIDHRPLLVKQFAGGASEELLLDWDLTPGSLDTETRLSILTGWVLAAEQNHLRYGLRLPGRTLKASSGEAHQQICLQALALHEAG